MTEASPSSAPSSASEPAVPVAPPRPGLPWFHYAFLTLLVLTGCAAAALMWLSSKRPPAAPAVEMSAPPLPVYGKISAPLTTEERMGRTVSTTALQGKVWLAAYTYSRCPHGCLGVVAHMLGLRDEFGSRPDFHLVSVAVGPEIDTAENLRAFASASGVNDTDPWWFLSGNREALRDFMTFQLGLAPTIDTPEEERLSEFDLFEHDLRVVLIDRDSRIRGYYEVQNPDAATAALHLERLRADVRRLLDEK